MAVEREATSRATTPQSSSRFLVHSSCDLWICDYDRPLSMDQSTNSAVVTVQKSVKVRVCIQKRGRTVITVTHTIINFRDLFVVAVVFAFKFKPTNLL